MSGNAIKSESATAAAVMRAVSWARGRSSYELMAGVGTIATVAGVYIYLAVAMVQYTV